MSRKTNVKLEPLIRKGVFNVPKKQSGNKEPTSLIIPTVSMASGSGSVKMNLH